MKKILKLIKFILRIVNNFIPKKKCKIVFKSVPDYSGNAKALSDYIVKNHQEYKVIWLVDNVDVNHPSHVIFVKSKTIKSLWHLFTSKFISTTHNEYVGIKAYRQHHISLWHGMPFKKIGYLGESDYGRMKDYSAIRIATSEVMRSIISASFREKANNVYVTGQPRNDYLFEPIEFNDLGLNIPKEKKIVMYVPTFRFNTKDKNFSDGEEIKGNNFLRVEDYSLDELDSYLGENNYHLLLKLHPYEEQHFHGITDLTNNITVITSEHIIKKSIDLNQILPLVGVLITDYSSVYYDYLILNKPIIFLIPDKDAYSDSRSGFTLEPFDFWTPGVKVTNQSSLIKSLEQVLNGEDPYLIERITVNAIINKYSDDKNCLRVVELMKRLN